MIEENKALEANKTKESLNQSKPNEAKNNLVAKNNIKPKK
jgi:hypothetical protein